MTYIRKSSKAEALHGLRFAGWVVFTLFTLGLLFWGAGRAFAMEGPGSKPAGWVALTLAFVILFFTIQWWGRQLWGLLFLAAFNGLLMAASGHLLNNPSVPVSRVQALLGAGLFGMGGFLARRYRSDQLRAVDKIALMLFIGCLVWAFMTPFFTLPVAIGAAGLGIAWGLARLHQRKSREEQQRQPDL